jgi:hypothetical protein
MAIELREGWRRSPVALAEYHASIGGAFIEEADCGYDAEAFVSIADDQETLELHRFFTAGCSGGDALETAMVWCERATKRLIAMATGDAGAAE